MFFEKDIKKVTCMFFEKDIKKSDYSTMFFKELLQSRKGYQKK